MFDERFNYSSVTTVDPFVLVAFDLVPSRVNLAFEYDCNFVSDQQVSGSGSGGFINQPRSVYAVHLRVRM
jgi:hypothetical protein